jgi:hypothetical protein
MRADTTYAAGLVTSLGVYNPTTDIGVQWTLKNIKRIAKPAKVGAKETVALDLTTKVAATSLKWMEKANGTTDINKFYLMGSQSQVRGEAATPFTQHMV